MVMHWLRSRNDLKDKILAGVILISPAIIFFIPVDWLIQQNSICLSKVLFHTSCYGCGITKAVILFFQGEINMALGQNRFVVIVFPLLCYLWFKNSRKLYYLWLGSNH